MEVVINSEVCVQRNCVSIFTRIILDEVVLAFGRQLPKACVVLLQCLHDEFSRYSFERRFRASFVSATIVTN
jgi:hypothetical protein